MTESDISTLVVGIDGASAELIDRLTGSGSLPTISGLLNHGLSGTLESQVPPTLASAWTSVSTGVNPGSHGVFGPETYSGVRGTATAADVSELSLREILSINGKRSVLVNVPVTHAGRTFDGALVPGRGAPRGQHWCPSTLRDSYEQECGPYRIHPKSGADADQEYPQLVRMRGEAFRFLAERYNPSLGFVVFSTPEAALRDHPNDDALLETVYAAIDDQIDRIIDQYDPSTVLLASAYGMARCNVEFRVNEFLRRKGFVEPTTELLAGRRDQSDRLRPILETATSITAKVKRLASSNQIGDRMMDTLPRSSLLDSTVDYDMSTAYMRESGEPGIRVNLQTDGGVGGIPPDDYELVRDELIEALSELRTPDGRPMFTSVDRCERYFWGRNTGNAADVVFVPHDLNWSVSTALEGEVFADPDCTWCPTFKGFLSVTGETVDTSTDLDGAHLFDCAPTVLASLEVPVSDRMDGDVLPGVPATRRFAYPLPEHCAGRDSRRETSDGV